MWVVGAEWSEAFRRAKENREVKKGREVRNWGKNLKVDGCLWPWITG